MSLNSSRPIPSRMQLLKATAVAAAVAGLILVTAVLPAEHGIDPTGIGARLGLTRLAEVPEAEPASSEASIGTAPTVVPTPAPVAAETVARNSAPVAREIMSLTLAPGKGAEIKTRMKAGGAFVFQWRAVGGPVAVDMHGERVDAAKDEYTSYWIEPSQASASGSFTAPFEGSHGWYWHNRGDTPVTITVEASGFLGAFYRP